MAPDDQDGVSFLPLGVGDAFSSLYYSACVALEADRSVLLIDCPHPIQKMLREASLSAGREIGAEQISAVVLTHLHADHCSGVEGLGFYFRYTLGRRLPILAHPDVAQRLWEGHLSAGMEWASAGPDQPPARRGFSDFFELFDLDEGAPVSFGPFSVECRRTLHFVPTTALRISTGGRTLGFSADTAYDPSLLEWLSPSHRIIHETGPGMHTPYEKLLELPSSLREKLRLIHYPDSFPAGHSEIEALRQGRRYGF